MSVIKKNTQKSGQPHTPQLIDGFNSMHHPLKYLTWLHTQLALMLLHMCSLCYTLIKVTKFEKWPTRKNLTYATKISCREVAQ